MAKLTTIVDYKACWDEVGRVAEFVSEDARAQAAATLAIAYAFERGSQIMEINSEVLNTATSAIRDRHQ